MLNPITTSTKTIARETGRSVKEINTVARDLDITYYDHDLKSWRVADRLIPILIDYMENY